MTIAVPAIDQNRLPIWQNRSYARRNCHHNPTDAAGPETISQLDERGPPPLRMTQAG